MAQEVQKIIFTCQVEGFRLDAYTADYLSGIDDENEGEAYRTFSRSQVARLLEEGNITVNGLTQKANYKVKNGDEIAVILPPPETEISAKPENIPLDIVYEDSDIIVINKPRGMVVHPANGNQNGTLVNALLYHCNDLSDINGTVRPGIVHRIDKDTTGLIAVAKNNDAHLFLAEQLKTHTMARVYYAVTEGYVKADKGTVNAPLGRHPVDRKKMAVVPNGKPAVTHFNVLHRENGFSLVHCRLETGRTHQIRVHLSYIGFPIVGDPVYGIKNTRGVEGQLLHAGQLSLIHPKTREIMTFKAELPADFSKFLDKEMKGYVFENE